MWRTAGLAEYDKHVTGTFAKETEKSLRDMLLLLSSHGGYHSSGQVEIPYNISDLEVSIQAIRAITAAPGWLANFQDADLLARVEKLKTFVRQTPARNNYERVLRLKLHHLMPELVSKADADAAIALLWGK